MRVLKSITLFLDWLVGLVLGASVVVWTVWGVVSPSDLAFHFPAVATLRGILLLAAGTLLLALNIMLVWGFLTRMFGMEYLQLDSGVNVSVRALQDALERAVLDIAEVSGARVKITPPARKGKSVILEAYVSLKGHVVYHSISKSIINCLERTFDDIVSEGAPVKCSVFWEKIRQDRSGACLLYTSPSPRDRTRSRMPSSA